MDFGFKGRYGVYHSVYDSFAWFVAFEKSLSAERPCTRCRMKNWGDPTFQYHVAHSQLWGLMLLRLLDDNVLPFNVSDQASDLLVYIAEAQALAGAAAAMTTSDGSATALPFAVESHVDEHGSLIDPA